MVSDEHDFDEPTSTEDLGRSYASVTGDFENDTELPGDPPVEESPSAEDTPPDPLRILEALLFVGGEPLTAEKAGGIIRGLDADQFTISIDTLNRDYRKQGRPYVLQAKDQGYILTLRPKYRSVVERLYGGPKEARLSTAAVDALALVAYQQPVTKSEIDNFRGAESGALLKQLVRRGMIQVSHRGEGKDREALYSTTARFLEFFGLSSLDDLPRTQDLQQI